MLLLLAGSSLWLSRLGQVLLLSRLGQVLLLCPMVLRLQESKRRLMHQSLPDQMLATNLAGHLSIAKRNLSRVLFLALVSLR
jgi:hypothetical protein